MEHIKPTPWIQYVERLSQAGPSDCTACDGSGLVWAGGCNCGGGPDGHPAHEPLCGAYPCPNGCWDKLAERRRKRDELAEWEAVDAADRMGADWARGMYD